MRAPLHCTLQGVFVLNMSLETLLWVSRDSGETLDGISAALYLIGNLCLHHKSWDPSVIIRRRWWDSLWELPCIVSHTESLYSTWVSRPFSEHQEAVVRLSMRPPLHCTSQGVFVFIISLETLLWASRGSGETLNESSPALYLTGSLCLQHESCDYEITEIPLI